MRIICTLFLFFTTYVFSANTDYTQWFTFKNISTGSGLSHPRVTALDTDAYGYLWIGTFSGLNVYDGYDFITFRHDPSDSTSLSDDYIRYIYKDRSGIMWIGTDNGILNRYNRENQNFSRYDLHHAQLSRKGIKKIHEDNFGNLWIACLDGLVKFQPETGEYSLFHNPDFPGTSGTLETFYIDTFGRFWVGYWLGGVYIFDPSAGTFSRFGSDDAFPWLQRISVMNIQEDKQHNLWVGTYNYGLFKFSHPNLKITNYQHLESDFFSLNSNKIKTFEIDNNENIWIGTEEGGLDYFNKREEKFYHYLSEFQSAHTAEGHSIYALKKTADGKLWIGTREDGLFLTRTTPNPFVHINPVSKESDGGNLIVTSLCEDSGGNLWAALKDDIALVDTENLILYPQHIRIAETPNVISCDGKGNLWIGGLRGGVYILNRKDKTLQKIHIEEISQLKIFSFHFQNDEVWISSEKNPVIYNQSNGKTRIVNEELLKDAFLLEKADSDFYFFTRKLVLSGKSLLFSGSGETSLVRIPFDFPNSKCALISPAKIYNGTDAGMYVIDRKTFEVKYLEKLPGQVNYEVNAIFMDRNGKVWFSNAYQVVQYDEKNNHFRVFDEFDGVPEIRFRDNVGCMLNDGRIAFGGEKGIILFTPEETIQGENASNLVFTGFSIGNKKDTENLNPELLRNGKKIRLKYNQNFFTIRFSLLSFHQPEKVLYRYRLSGFDDEWIVQYHSRQKTYMNLPYGKYTFEVSARGSDNVWSEAKILPIEIAPPFWLKWYAYLFYTGVALFLLYLFRLYNIKRERLKHELKLQEVRIENIGNLARKENELNEMKLRFFTNISHEFKTPLTLIISPLEQYAETLKPLSHEIISQIHNNAIRLKHLVSQVMDIRRIDSGNMELTLSFSDIIRFVKEIGNHFKPLANNKKLVFELITHEEELYTGFDSDKLEKILYNLLSNAVKFTSKGKVKLEIGRFVEKTDPQKKEFVEIVVKDTGPGIPEKDTNKIFDRFYQVKQNGNHPEGTGIGLSLVKEMVKLHNGTISVQSHPGEGTKFTVRLPVTQDGIIVETSTQDRAEDSISTEKEYQPMQNTGKKVILIAEDNPEMRNYMAGELLGTYEIIEAADGTEAFDKCLKNNPDLILSDVLMPGADGFEFCKQVKNDERTSHIPILLVTALSGNDYQKQGYHAGADDYIIKPFNIGILKEKIRNFIATRENLKSQFIRDAWSEPEILKIASGDEKFLKRSNELIEENLSDSEYDIDDFARDMATSRSQLYRKLKALTGLSASEFIKITRLKIAARLISDKNCNVSEAAYMVGFKDPKYFSKCFQKQFGVIPSRYKTKKETTDV